MEKYFLQALFLTIFLETLVLLLALKVFAKEPAPQLSQILFAGFFSSFATLPYLWFVLPMYLHSKHYLDIGELGVTLLEALIFRQILKLDWKYSLLTSALCNAVSYFAGGFIMAKLMG